MMLRVLLGAAFACALAACNEPTRTTEGKEGAYGASSGPNANDPDADVAAQDRDPDLRRAANGDGLGVRRADRSDQR